MIRPSGRSDRIRELDGWRAISIAMVILGHLINFRYSYVEFAQPLKNFAGALSVLGVNVFFVISGFIITRLAIAERERTGQFEVGHFYLRRIFRIVPAFLFYLAALTVLSREQVINHQFIHTLFAATFTCNFLDCGWFAGHSWSLAYEEQFYILFPIAFAGLQRRSKDGFLAIFLLATLFPFIRYLLSLGGLWTVLGNYLPSFCFISIGALMACHEDLVRKLFLCHWNRLITLIAYVFILGSLYLSANAEMGSQNAYLSKAVNVGLLPVSLAWIVGVTLFKPSLLTAFLRLRAVQYCGMISYSLYLWQQLFAAQKTLVLVETWIMNPLFLIVIASFSHFFIERPFVRLGRRIAANATRLRKSII